jgi:hypothetical protein
MNGGAFDGGALSAEEKELRDFYRRLLAFSARSPVMQGHYADIQEYNRARSASAYSNRVFSFVRWNGEDKLVVVCNFDARETFDLEIGIPEAVIKSWELADGHYELDERLYGEHDAGLVVADGRGLIKVELEPLESLVYSVATRDASKR